MTQSRYCPKCGQIFDLIGDSVWTLLKEETITLTCEERGFDDCNPDSDYKPKEQQTKTPEPDKKK